MDKDFLGDRRRALEEEYFAKLNRALIDWLRAADAADGKSDDAGDSLEVENNPTSDDDGNQEDGSAHEPLAGPR